MPATPLSHHEILTLVAPFTQRGHAVDLPASDRAARRLAFKPQPREGGRPGGAPLSETLTLDNASPGWFVLTRQLDAGAGLVATVQAAGAVPEALLAALEAVPPASQFSFGAGHAIARSHECSASGGPRLSSGVVQVAGLTLKLNLLDVRGAAGDLRLAATAGGPVALPDDLLAVQGWAWSWLQPAAGGWTGRVRLRGRGAQRSQAAAQALQDAAVHLARVLAEPPAQFHQRFLAARWGVVLRRAIPSLTALALVAAALGLPAITGKDNAGVWMALHYLPIAVLALSFKLQELARFEIPPLPRRPAADAWPVAAAAGASVAG